MFFFFFSSRRRHTRCSRDWSSDVCSSDLLLDRLAGGGVERRHVGSGGSRGRAGGAAGGCGLRPVERSEERRGGKGGGLIGRGVIGVGKPRGAMAIHATGPEGLGPRLLEAW